MAAIRAYERPLLERLLSGLMAIPGVTLYGITDSFGFNQRAPPSPSPWMATARVRWRSDWGCEGIFVWGGNYYALAVTERRGVEESGGMVRVGIAYYNTATEVDRLLGEVVGLVWP